MHSGLKEIEYGKKEVPIIKLTLYLEDRAIYTLVSTSLKEYFEELRTESKTHRCIPEVRMTDALMNPMDYEILIARKYDKYVLEVTDIWRSVEGADEEFTRVLEFNSLSIGHAVDFHGDPADWYIVLENEV